MSDKTKKIYEVGEKLQKLQMQIHMQWNHKNTGEQMFDKILITKKSPRCLFVCVCGFILIIVPVLTESFQQNI